MSNWKRWVTLPEPEEEEEEEEEEDANSVGEEKENESQVVEVLQRIQPLRTVRRPAPLGEDLLRLENITVVFDGFKALDIESFSLAHCDMRVIIGPNGAGKTTLCDVISGKTRPTTGAVYFHDTEITAMSEEDCAMACGRCFGFEIGRVSGRDCV